MANYLLDIDGTICEDIPNEESHRYPEAVPYDNAAMYIQRLADMGHKITYFTAREEKDREVTMKWLTKHGFPIDGLIMGKPRGGKYIWVDNLTPKGVTFWGGSDVHKEWTPWMFSVVVQASEDNRLCLDGGW